MNLADYIVRLRIATRAATLCESSVNGKSMNSITLKTKILYLLKESSLTPSDIMSILHLAKTNLAILANSMIKDGLMIKTHSAADKREIAYNITEKGIEYLNERLDVIENSASNIDEDYDDACAKLADALNVLEFII